MMLPARTHCPPDRFTPSRCDAESRPFFELDTPFLCAMLSSFFLVRQVDVQDLDPGQLVPVPDLAPVFLATLVGPDVDLLPLLMADHLHQDHGALDERLPHLNLIPLRDQEDAIKRDLGTRLLVEARQDVLLVLGYAELKTPRLDDRESRFSFALRLGLPLRFRRLPLRRLRPWPLLSILASHPFPPRVPRDSATARTAS